MIPIAGQMILTAADMRAAEDRAIHAGATVDSLMARAGAAIALAVHRLAAGRDVLVLCGPGNNGGDGYVAASTLRASGMTVRIAALGDPKGDAAKAARAGWNGPVETLAAAAPASVLVDALFGTGLTRSLDLAEVHRLAATATLRIAIDLPSGVDTDTGKALGIPPMFDLTLALGAVKPSHLLQPAARYCGTVRLLDIGVEASSHAEVLAPPTLPDPGPDAHKYTRGMVAVIAGAMPGATDLAAQAAMYAGAGYVTVLGQSAGPPHALVRTPFGTGVLGNDRIGAVVIGPGLGRDMQASTRLNAALAAGHPLVIDGDALRLVTPDTLAGLTDPVILTPHAGEFDALFGTSDTDKITRARDAAKSANAVVVFKGADTVIAAPDGRVAVAPHANDWLSTAGTGDVLAGAIGAILAAIGDAFAAAKAGVWLHGDAARRLGAAFIADDLATTLRQARASL